MSKSSVARKYILFGSNGETLQDMGTKDIAKMIADSGDEFAAKNPNTAVSMYCRTGEGFTVEGVTWFVDERLIVDRKGNVKW